MFTSVRKLGGWQEPRFQNIVTYVRDKMDSDIRSPPSVYHLFIYKQRLFHNTSFNLVPFPWSLYHDKKYSYQSLTENIIHYKLFSELTSSLIRWVPILPSRRFMSSFLNPSWYGSKSILVPVPYNLHKRTN